MKDTFEDVMEMAEKYSKAELVKIARAEGGGDPAREFKDCIVLHTRDGIMVFTDGKYYAFNQERVDLIIWVGDGCKVMLTEVMKGIKRQLRQIEDLQEKEFVGVS